jgi:hypothetical protein
MLTTYLEQHWNLSAVTITAHPQPEAERGQLHWRTELDPGATWTTTLTVAIEGVTAPVARGL